MSMVERSAAYAELREFIWREQRRLVVAKVKPWRALGHHRPLTCEAFDGSVVSYENVCLDGSPRKVFWAFLDPFLRDLVVRSIRHAVELADERHLARAAPIREACADLRTAIVGVYREMHRVDTFAQRACVERPSPPPDTFALNARMREFMEQVASSWPEREPPRKLSPIERDIVKTLTKAGHRMRGEALLLAAKREPHSGSNREILSKMVKAGILDSSRAKGGYALAEWVEREDEP